MKNGNTWGIIGLGWLGESLNEFLRNKNVQSWGTHRSDFNWMTDAFPSASCDVLFLNTPPLVEMPPQQFVAKIPDSFQKILFVSSISVYGDQEGIVTEDTPLSPVTASGKWLSEVEALLLNKFKNQITIIRPGGLIGGDRHPAISLSKRNRPCASQTPINLIHRDDLTQIIWQASQLLNPPRILNAVAPYHPSKKEYYSEWTEKLGLSAITFEDSAESSKIVSSIHLAEIYPSWIHPTLKTL